MRDTTPTPESDSGAPSVPNEYRTRSGRVVRQAVRYEPDPDTVFLDDSDYESHDDGMDEEEEGEEYDEGDDDGSVVDTEDDSVCDSDIDDSDSDMDEDEYSTDASSVMSEDDLDDVIDWDTLTEQASDRDLIDTDEDELGEDLAELSDEEYEEE